MGTKLNQKYKNLSIEVYKDTNIEEDVSKLELIEGFSVDFPYYIETVEDLISKVLQSVPEFSNLKKDNIEHVEELDEFSVLLCSCKKDYTPISKEEYGFQTEDNYSYYIRIYAIFEQDYLNTEKCSMNIDLSNPNFYSVRSCLYTCEACDRYNNCSYVQSLRNLLKTIKDKMTKEELQKELI